MKTTVEIGDALLKGARELAAARSTTLSRIVEEGLILVVDASKEKRPPYRMRDVSVGAKGPAPHMTWEEMRALIYEGHGG